ncbi:hypothetical protein GUJ93_ZPchr0013g34779 [Zizania palustris]|uniref:Major facilitator superfamily (MFS) profile domain-containing protein n=1 Tax=Zizania palustris TaxID=103762 RepID=A0A8J5WWZ3_ZIZPA|nr:hypothetical protein GUJ93_ZPchr0013g34779 [Zizania palustris]
MPRLRASSSQRWRWQSTRRSSTYGSGIWEERWGRVRVRGRPAGTMMRQLPIALLREAWSTACPLHLQSARVSSFALLVLAREGRRTQRSPERAPPEERGQDGGGFSVSASASASSGTEFEAKITPIVIISCIMAATGGLMFGYDVGISGPAALYLVALPLAGLTATFFASYTPPASAAASPCSSPFFLSSSASSQRRRTEPHHAIIGRILLGCGVGFANQAVPLFLSEIAPTGSARLNILFQLNPDRARRLEDGNGGAEEDQGHRQRGAGIHEIVAASRVAQEVKHPFRNLLQRRNRPHWSSPCCSDIPASDVSLYSRDHRRRHLLATLVSVLLGGQGGAADAAAEAGVADVLSQWPSPWCWHQVTDRSDTSAMAGPSWWSSWSASTSPPSPGHGAPSPALPSETFPLETRSAGQSITVCVNLLFTFVIAQAFLSALPPQIDKNEYGAIRFGRLNCM